MQLPTRSLLLLPIEEGEREPRLAYGSALEKRPRSVASEIGLHVAEFELTPGRHFRPREKVRQR